jgi:hypothetical protein
MSVETQLAELERKHRALEQEIEAELAHLAGDDLRLRELKRRKLHLKDEMTRLRSHQSIH